MKQMSQCLFSLGLLLIAAPIQAQQSTLMIRSDADCALTVNGMPQGLVTAGSVKAVTVGAGDQLVECSAGGVKDEKVLEVFPGAQKLVNIGLAGEIKRRARFKAGSNTVLDTESGLTWLAADNGASISWSSAKGYCAKFSPGVWVLPTVAELQTLSGADAEGVAFKRSASNFWSSEQALEHMLSPPAYWPKIVNLWSGAVDVRPPDIDWARALCVKRNS